MKVSIPVTNYQRGEFLTEREEVIYEIQQSLRNIAKSKSDEPAIIPDGIFSGETKKAVLDFQQAMGLEETGVVDFITFEALRKENERVILVSRESE